MTSASTLFQPLAIGDCKLDHRIVMAPMTRFRTDSAHTPLPMAVEYYRQRSHTPGTLLITEGVAVSERLVGLPAWAGCWTDAQSARWREIVRAIHAQKCFVFQQFCCAGRTADKGFPKLSSGDVPLESGSSAIATEDDVLPPTPMTKEDIRQAISDHASAARRAVEVGFDGVEIHGANGYLIDQFIQESCNNRTDEWGGSVQNRARFALEITKAIVDAVGPQRVGFRISPWSTYHSITPIRPQEQFAYLVRELSKLKLAYLHVITSKVDNWYDVDRDKPLDFVFDNWDESIPVIITGGFDGETAARAVETYSTHKLAVGFGRAFASTPDLVECIKRGIKPNDFRGDLAYTHGVAEGYVDYPFLARS